MRAETLLAVTISFALLAGAQPAAAAPLKFSVQGRLTDAQGVNREGTVSIVARLWSAATGGTLLYEEAARTVSVVNGNFQLRVGEASSGAGQFAALDGAFNGVERFLEFQAAGESPMLPRQSLLSVPYAVRAKVAESLSTSSMFTVSQASVSIPLTFFGSTPFSCLSGATLNFTVRAGERAQLVFNGSLGNSSAFADTLIGFRLDGALKGVFCDYTNPHASFSSPCTMDFLSEPLAAGQHQACVVATTPNGTGYFLVDGTAEGAGRRALFEVRVLGGQ